MCPLDSWMKKQSPSPKRQRVWEKVYWLRKFAEWCERERGGMRQRACSWVKRKPS